MNKFELKLNKDKLEPFLEFLKLLITLSSLFIGSLALKTPITQTETTMQIAVGMCLLSVVTSLATYAHLAEFKSSDKEYPGIKVSLYFYIAWQSFLFAILALAFKYVF